MRPTSSRLLRLLLMVVALLLLAALPAAASGGHSGGTGGGGNDERSGSWSDAGSTFDDRQGDWDAGGTGRGGTGATWWGTRTIGTDGCGSASASRNVTCNATGCVRIPADCAWGDVEGQIQDTEPEISTSPDGESLVQVDTCWDDGQGEMHRADQPQEFDFSLLTGPDSDPHGTVAGARRARAGHSLVVQVHSISVDPADHRCLPADSRWLTGHSPSTGAATHGAGDQPSPASRCRRAAA